jgi:hypothetical protein
MTSGKWSENEPSVAIDSVDDLDCFVDFVESKAKVPTAISVDVHGYRVDLLVGHEKSFVHMSPEDLSHPYHVTIGGDSDGVVDFCLHSISSYAVRKSSPRKEELGPRGFSSFL